MNILLKKPDVLGALASSLCLVHCAVAPLLFIMPTWWKQFDYIFLAISLVAVYQSSRTTSSAYVKYGMWLSWTALFVLLMNEKFEGVHLPEILVFLTSISLGALHLYNRKYCNCKTDSCCSDNG